MEIGTHVIYVDPVGKSHDALVTNQFGSFGDPDNPDAMRPSLNLVYVSGDTDANDQYGRQLATRVTSTPHKSQQAAHGNYWHEA